MLSALTGLKVVPRLNAGLLRIQREGICLERIEELLEKTGLARDTPVNFYAEQTLYACELSAHGAVPLDLDRYTICGDPDSARTVTGHYCGGGFWATRFYNKGLPRLAAELGSKEACARG